MSAHVPAKRLGGFYFAYYAAIGALIPYLGLYLVDKGMGPAEVGNVIAILAITRIFAPYLWGIVADRSQQRMQVVQLTLGGALLCFIGLAWTQQFWPTMAVMFVYGCLVNGTMGQFEVVTFAHLADKTHGYARIRLWGSLGFVLAVAMLGPLLELWGIRTLPFWIAGFFLAAAIVAIRIPNPVRQTATALGPSAMNLALKTPIFWVLVGSFLAQISFGPYYGFYSIYLKDHGYSKWAIGALWSLGVMAEVAVFWVIPRRMPRYSLKRLFVVSQIVSALRWALTPILVESLWLTAGVQLLHAISFGVYHLAAVNLVQKAFPPTAQGRGQAIYIGVAYGAGGAVGGWAAGQLWLQIPQFWVWMLAAATALLAGLVVGFGFVSNKPSGMMSDKQIKE